jgi:hypothetical protein
MSRIGKRVKAQRWGISRFDNNLHALIDLGANIDTDTGEAIRFQCLLSMMTNSVMKHFTNQNEKISGGGVLNSEQYLPWLSADTKQKRGNANACT